MLKLEMCRLHPIALHGFDFLKTHTLLFHFAGGCCNGSNSHRGERSRWTCSGRCAILSKNDWSDFVQCLWSGFKGNYGNSWFCDILCLFCSGTFHQKNNKNFQPYCGDSSQPSSTFTPRKQKQTNPTSECIFFLSFFKGYRLSLHMVVSLFNHKKRQDPNVLSHGIRITTTSDPSSMASTVKMVVVEMNWYLARRWRATNCALGRPLVEPDPLDDRDDAVVIPSPGSQE